MKKTSDIKDIQIVVIILLLNLLIFHRGLFNFFTHDDFYHFTLANVNSFKEILGFFNFFKSPEGWGFYRPITTQLTYLLGIKLFKLNAFLLHFLALILFWLVGLLVYKFFLEITNNKKTSQISLFFYLISASHFTHLYSIANQELGLAVFFLISLLLAIKVLKGGKRYQYQLSLLSFILALMSKEFASILPICLALTALLLKKRKLITYSYKRVLAFIAPFFLISLIYGYIHIFHYGLPQGDSYIWKFSFKTGLNSLAWYGLWSINIPKMLPDFIGPGLKVNPNLWKFWGTKIIPILILNFIFIITLAYQTLKNKKELIKNWPEFIWGAAWFISLLLPVIFLPWHKFWEYLTLPLIGLSMIAGTITSGKNKPIILMIFLLSSLLTVNLSHQTEWTAQGARVAKKVFNYITKKDINKNYSKIIFYDTPNDNDLPWQPHQQLKIILSDNNFFKVYFHELEAEYLENKGLIDVSDPSTLYLPARFFLGY